MEIDQHLIWLLGAIKASISISDVDEKKLNKNISDCLARVKNAYASGNQEQNFEDFKVKSTLVLLLCCPAVRNISVVQSSKDFQAIILTFPELKESVFFSVVRNQKFYKFLMPVLACLPPVTLKELLQAYFTCTNDVTPVTLAIALELLKAALFSVQNTSSKSDCKEENPDIFQLFLKFHSLKKVSNGSSAQVKSSAYYFMYLCECTYVVLSSYAGKGIEQLKVYKASQAWADLWKLDVDETTNKTIPVSSDVLKSFLQMCQENVKAVTVDIWMEWNELPLPVSVTVHRKSVASQTKLQQSTIQSVICNIAFDTLKLVDAHSSVNDVLNTADCDDLLQFFKQVASDPDYDPDQDLTIDQLLVDIDLKDERRKKLLDILLKKDDIFSAEKCINCIMAHSEVADSGIILQVLVRLIKHIRGGKEYNNKSIEMVLNMAESLPPEQLLPVIENYLSSGQDEILKGEEFNQQMTAIFNQLADGNTCKSSSKHVWLCLQSGRTVVYEAVKLPIVFPGLVNVMVKSLTSIPQVCKAIGQSGVSVLVDILQERQNTGLQGREQQDFSALVNGLVKGNILLPQEVMKLLVQPSLKVSSVKELENLYLPLELLKGIIEHDVQAIVKPGPELVALVLTLVHVIHATSYLNSSKISVNLKLRTDSQLILRYITQIMMNDHETYERDISMLKQMIVKINLHPRALLQLQMLLDCREQNSTNEDCLLQVLWKVRLQQLEGKQLQIGNVIDLPQKLKDASKEKWILALLQLLPHSSEEEWIIAFYVTHHYLKAGRMALHTMLIFQKVLYLACTQVMGLSKKEGDAEEEEDFRIPSISVQHCFKCFANASMLYIEHLMKGLPYDRRFKSVCSIFRWWCRAIPMYQFHEELPSLLLMQLCTAIEDMFNAENLQLSGVEEVGAGLQLAGTSKEGKGKKKHKDVTKKTVTAQAMEEVNDSEKRVNVEKDQNGDMVEEMSRMQLDQTKIVNVKKVESDASERSETPASNTIPRGKVDNEANFSENANPTSSVAVQKYRTKIGDQISRTEYRKEIEQVVLFFMKYVPSSNLASSIAGKLKKLHEML